MTDAPSPGAAPGWPLPLVAAVAAIVALGFGLRLAAYSPLDILHPDELMQYYEQAYRHATGLGSLPWEARYGLRNLLVVQLLMGPVWLGHTLAPDSLMALHLAHLAIGALSLVVLPAAWRLGTLTSRGAALVALFVAATWWHSVLFSDLLLSETVGAALMLAAAPTLLAGERSQRRLALAGLLLGLGALVRLQYAPFALVLAALALRRDAGAWRALATGGLAAAAIGAGSDLAMGRTPFAWAWINVTMNVTQGRAASFGTSGPLAYLQDLWIQFGWLVVPMAVLPWLAGRRYWPLLAAAIVNVIVHSCIAHKEFRFIWVSLLVVLVLAAIGSVRAGTLAARSTTFSRFSTAFSPAARNGRNAALGLALACLMWTFANAASLSRLGGLGAVRSGSEITALARLAAARDDRHGGPICAVAIAEEFNTHLVPTQLPPGTRLYVAPWGMSDGYQPLPGDLERAANAMITRARPQRHSEWRPSACREGPLGRTCLYVRPGSCEGVPARWSYQASLERQGR